VQPLLELAVGVQKLGGRVRPDAPHPVAADRARDGVQQGASLHRLDEIIVSAQAQSLDGQFLGAFCDDQDHGHIDRVGVQRLEQFQARRMVRAVQGQDHIGQQVARQDRSFGGVRCC